jgi:polyphosphate kinase
MPEKKPSAAKSSRAGKPPGPGKPAEQGPTTRESAAKKSGAKKVAAKRATKSSAKRDAASAPESLFFDRDESWMRFNQRVLEEAEDASNPLLERVKFLAITASNLDEFVEIRVASLLQRIEDGYDQPQRPDEGGLTLSQRLDRLSVVLHEFVDAQYECWSRKLRPALAAEKVRILDWNARAPMRSTFTRPRSIRC